MATQIWVNIGSGDDLLPNGTKPLNELMLTCHQSVFVTFTGEPFLIIYLDNRPISQIPQCTCSISQNAPEQKCAHFYSGALWDVEQVRCGSCELGQLGLLPSGNYCDYYPGTLYLSQVTATHLKMRHS